jgi:hypothetical protein
MGTFWVILNIIGVVWANFVLKGHVCGTIWCLKAICVARVLPTIQKDGICKCNGHIAKKEKNFMQIHCQFLNDEDKIKKAHNFGRR